VSNIACLIKRDVFLKYNFRGDYAEDLDLGLRLIRDGYKMTLLSSTRVIHSHNRPAFYHLQRGYVENLFLVKTFSDHETETEEAGSLIEEIILVYESVRALLEKELGPSVKSCSMRALSAIVMDGLTVSSKHSLPIQVTMEASTHVDERFQSFMANVYRLYRSSEVAGSTYCGTLLLSYRSFVTTILQYMQQIYDEVDEPLLDDFRNSLFKAFALICGFKLGASAGRGSPATKKILHELCADLYGSI
jgi:hypothetical protein